MNTALLPGADKIVTLFSKMRQSGQFTCNKVVGMGNLNPSLRLKIFYLKVAAPVSSSQRLIDRKSHTV